MIGGAPGGSVETAMCIVTRTSDTKDPAITGGFVFVKVPHIVVFIFSFFLFMKLLCLSARMPTKAVLLDSECRTI